MARATPLNPTPATPTRLAGGVTDDQVLVLLAVCAGVVYALLGLTHTGFYQQDEAAHYIDMRAFWYDPNRILYNWNKVGYKLLYALPALLGPKFVLLFNAAVAGLTVWVTGQAGKAYGLKSSLLPALLLATQPFWVMLAFRNYAELPSALLFALAVWQHLKGRYLWAALAAGYALLLRQEAIPIMGLYGLWLLYRRQWGSAVVLALPPLLHHVWGWLATGDALFLVHQLLGDSAKTQDAWPRQGFNHYFLLSLTIFGAFALTGFVAWVGLAARKAVSLAKAWPILLPAVLYFLLHCLFNLQDPKLGPSTGGNLRYLIAISPLVALLAAEAYSQTATSQAWRVALGLVGAFGLLVALYMTYAHNFIVLTEVRSYQPLGLVVLAGVVLFLPLGASARLWTVGVLSGFFLLATVRFPPQTEEEKLTRQVARQLKPQLLERPFFATNQLLYYYMDRPAVSLPQATTTMSDSLFLAAPKGTWVVWDSHYSHRPALNPRSVPHTWFLERPQAFKLIQQHITPDQRFGILVFEKQ